MNTLSSLRWAITTTIALSPFGIAETAQAVPGSVVVPTIPSSGSAAGYPTSFPTPASSVVVPVYTPGNFPSYPSTYPPITTPNPGVTTPRQLPPVPTLGQPIGGGTMYRVVVLDASDVTQQQVRRVAPNAFRTSVNGRSVIQAGLFRESSKATELQQLLSQNNLQASIIPGQSSQIPTTSPVQTSLPIYRVVVMNASNTTQQQVKRIAPASFRTSVNGQSVIQAGLFREQSKATELQQTLNRNNLQATIVQGQARDLLAPSSPGNSLPTNPGSDSLPSVPKTGTRVVIDPGHGGGDPGAVGIGGLRESEAVLDISRQIVTLLKQQGIDATLTRSRDVEIELEPRVQFAEQSNADVFVSIHANAFTAGRTDVNGIETYYYSGGSGRQLAQLVQASLLQELGAVDRGVKTANFYVIRYTSMPAILVETGFVTGAQDAARLSSASGRSRIARAIARGILQYVGQGTASR